MPAIVIQYKKAQECLRKHGVVYTVRLNNKQEGDVTVYFGRYRVAKGTLRKVADEVNMEVLDEYIEYSGFEDAFEWIEFIDRVFLGRGMTTEGYSDLALYEVRVTEWFEEVGKRRKIAPLGVV